LVSRRSRETDRSFCFAISIDAKLD
jgi:hypothetical protein